MNKYFLLLIGFIFTSCLKTDLSPTQTETPPRDNNLTWKTISEIRKSSNNIDKLIDDVWWLEAIVVSDDKQGNFYKQIYIQDSTGGMVVRINENPLYPMFPGGRLIRINLKGAYVQNYYGPIQLNGGVDVSDKIIPYTMAQVNKNFQLCSFLKPEPVIVTVKELTNTKYIGTLVKLDNFQVIEADTANTYSLPDYYLIRIENNNTPRDTFFLNVNSNATFANFKVPKGSGTIVGIYDTSTSTTPIRQPRQIFIRDTNDIQFYNARF